MIYYTLLKSKFPLTVLLSIILWIIILFILNNYKQRFNMIISSHIVCQCDDEKNDNYNKIKIPMSEMINKNDINRLLIEQDVVHRNKNIQSKLNEISSSHQQLKKILSPFPSLQINSFIGNINYINKNDLMISFESLSNNTFNNNNIPNSEMLSLYQFYNSTSGPYWRCQLITGTVNWNFSGPTIYYNNPCQQKWIGDDLLLLFYYILVGLVVVEIVVLELIN